VEQKDRSVIGALATVDRSAPAFAGGARRFDRKQAAITVAQRRFHRRDETIAGEDESLD
jgi:hypothetical protein